VTLESLVRKNCCNNHRGSGAVKGVGGQEGAVVPSPSKFFGLSDICPKIFFLSEIFLSQNAQFEAENPHFGKI